MKTYRQFLKRNLKIPKRLEGNKIQPNLKTSTYLKHSWDLKKYIFKEEIKQFLKEIELKH